jgi:hypothetical protein
LVDNLSVEKFDSVQYPNTYAKQELIEKDEEIARLEYDLEEISEELFAEVNLR